MMKHKEYKKQIECLINEGKLEETKSLLREYKNIQPNDFDNYIFEALIYYLEERFDEAIQILKSIYHKYEFNTELNYNLGLILFNKGEFDEAFYYLLRGICFDESDKKSEIVDFIKESVFSGLEDKDIVDKVKNSMSLRGFPKKGDGEIFCGEKVFSYDGKNYYSGIYDYYYPERTGIFLENLKNESLLKTENIPAEKARRISFECTKKTVIPLMVKNRKQKVNLVLNDKEYVLKNLLENRFYYYTFNEGDKVKISSENNFILGKKIILEKDDKKPSLILNIFVDGLSQKFLEENGLEDVAPNIYKFFKKGTICTNAYVTGDWTYVNLASFFSGKYITNHRIYHPRYESEGLYNQKLYSEVFNENGYFSAKIDGDWRSNPIEGYLKGIDRYVYQPSLVGMHADDVIIETIEHLEAFKDKNNFVWICLPDLHDIADEFEMRLSTQIENTIESRCFDKTVESSVKKKKDYTKNLRYRTQLKRLDTYIQILFDYIKNNYDENDYLVSLFADHGQGYLVKSDEFLDEERIKVPMMFRGRNIKNGICNDMIEGLDLFPIIFNALEIKDYPANDTVLPEYFGGSKSREYIYCESIFPKQKYCVAIIDNEDKYFFTTNNVTSQDGRINISDGYGVKVVNKKSNEDVTSERNQKIEEYTKIVFEHIKEYIIY